MPTERAKPDLLFVLSIDTEEEWDWSGPFPQRDFSVSNAQRLPEFQRFCDQRGIRPTYFVDYAVADDESAAAPLAEAAARQCCEIGAHLHPWANPPYFGDTGEFESHVVNLPRAQVTAKLDALITRLREVFGRSPNAFRTGRWGVNGTILELLRERGIGIDSSMYPLFRNDWFDCESTPLTPYWPDFREPVRPGQQRDVLEFPVTVGFNRRNQAASLALYNTIAHPAVDRARLVGAFWQSRLLRKLYLSPEVMSGEDMQPLVDMAIANRLPTLHMFLHSSSLIDHGRGMLDTDNAFETVTNRIAVLLEYAANRAHLRFCTISEAATLVSHRLPEHA